MPSEIFQQTRGRRVRFQDKDTGAEKSGVVFTETVTPSFKAPLAYLKVRDDDRKVWAVREDRILGIVK